MLTPTPEQKINWAISAALKAGDIPEAKRLLNENPHKLDDIEYLQRRFFAICNTGPLSVVEFFVSELSMSVNACVGIEKDTPLQCAIDGQQFEIAEWLLKLGANPNAGRPIIGAINIKIRGPEELALKYVKLLVQYGCDINQAFVFMGDKSRLFTALDWSGEKSLIGRYLRSQGGKTLDECNGVRKRWWPF